MKKVLFLVAFLFISNVIISGELKNNRAYSKEYSGYINFVVGKVSIKTADNKIKPAKVGDAVKEGMQVITKGKKSLVDIYFGMRAVRILGNTLVKVTKLAEGKGDGETEFFLEKGKIFSNIAKKLGKEESYRVKTPTTTAGVRGTEFLIEEGNKRSGVSCLDGKVAVREESKGTEIVVREAEEAQVEAGKDPVKNLIEKGRLERLKILTDVSQIKEEILNKFEDQKEEMKKEFVDKRQAQKQKLEEDKNRFRKLLEKLKNKQNQ